MSTYSYASIAEYVDLIKANYPREQWNELADAVGQWLGWLNAHA